MRRHFILGILLVLVGAALLGRNLGWLPAFSMPSLGAWWPLALSGAGVYLLFFSRATDVETRVVPGLVLAAYGAFLLLFASGRLGWGEMGRLWGVFPAVVGVALAVRYWIGGRTEHGTLVPTLVLLGVAAVPFVRQPWHTIHVYWPVAVVLVGVGVLLTRNS